MIFGLYTGIVENQLYQLYLLYDFYLIFNYICFEIHLKNNTQSVLLLPFQLHAYLHK